MKRPSYRQAIAWVAENDSPGDYDPKDECAVEFAGSIVSAILVADLFGVDSEKVGRDIVAYRLKRGF